MAIYSHITFAAAKQQIANRLSDGLKQFWGDSELGLYLIEALRTWNALTSYWRSDFTFQSKANTTWYDLTDPIAMPNTLRPLTLKDTDLYTLIQYHLLEPVSWNPWTGASLQFSADDLISAVQRRRDEILSVCGCTLTRSTVPAVAGRITLPDNVIDVRRMAYLPTPAPSIYGFGAYGVVVPYGLSVPFQGSVMWPEDAWAEQSFQRKWTLQPAGTPAAYLMSTDPPITFDVDLPPAFAGNYELLTVNAGPVLSITAASKLSIPDDWAHVIKWGALADLLSREYLSKDSLRASYCEQRYRMGLKLLSNASALLTMRLGNVPMQVDSVRAADEFQTRWQSQPAGTPEFALHAGLNLLALSPVADTGPYSLMATVVQNAPIPATNIDFVQVARDDLDALLDYAQHLAAFKMGGAEFLATMPLFERFLKQAAIYNAKLEELGEFTRPLFGLSQVQENMAPRMVSVADGG
jgi:hypothetical protein